MGFCKVEVNPPDPVHDHAVAPLEFAESATVPPTQIGPLLVVPVDDGTGLTVTEVVYTVDGLQPEPVVLTVNECVEVIVGVAVGFCKVDVNPPGPVHDHAVAPLEFAVSVTVPPTHIGPLFVAPEDAGTGLTVTEVV